MLKWRVPEPVKYDLPETQFLRDSMVWIELRPLHSDATWYYAPSSQLTDVCLQCHYFSSRNVCFCDYPEPLQEALSDRLQPHQIEGHFHGCWSSKEKPNLCGFLQPLVYALSASENPAVGPINWSNYYPSNHPILRLNRTPKSVAAKAR